MPSTKRQVSALYARTPSATSCRLKHSGGSSTGKYAARASPAASMNARAATHAARRTCYPKLISSMLRRRLIPSLR